MTHRLTITAVEPVTHNVKQFTFEKPAGYTFEPGQATEVGLDKDGFREDKHPFTFTALPGWTDLQFTIKLYPEHDGMTKQIGTLQKGDVFLIEDPWGTITYKGKGTFIAGGAGVTPFIAILRQLEKDGQLDGHRLIFANKTSSDIILRDEFSSMDGLETLYVLSEEEAEGCEKGRIDKAFLKAHVDDFAQNFYVCGPEKMVKDIKSALKDLGAEPDGVVFEE